MKEYEKLSEEFLESKMVDDPVINAFMKMSWQIGFLKARQMAVNIHSEKARYDDFDFMYKELRDIGEKEV